MRQKLEIPAARKIDLQNILSSHGIPPELDDDSLHCSVCNEKISWDNLGGIFIREDKPILFCDLSDCVEIISKQQSNTTS
jgi:hypothetical protein